MQTYGKNKEQQIVLGEKLCGYAEIRQLFGDVAEDKSDWKISKRQQKGSNQSIIH